MKDLRSLGASLGLDKGLGLPGLPRTASSGASRLTQPLEQSLQGEQVARGTEAGDHAEGHGRTSEGILADALGPDLRWATANVSKPERMKSTAERGEGYIDDDEPF